MNENWKNILIGKTIKTIHVANSYNEDESAQEYHGRNMPNLIRFEFEVGEPLTLSAEGDCCSAAYFIPGQDYIGLDPIISIEEKDYDLPDGFGPQESNKMTWYELKSESYRARISFGIVSSSNGYYGAEVSEWQLQGRVITQPKWTKVT